MSAESAEAAGAWPEEMDMRIWADSSMTLPGQGDPGSGCGEWFPAEFCDECGEPHFRESSCGSRSCPDCAASWSRDRAVGITERLEAARLAEPDGIERRAVHAVVSAPEGEIRSLNDVYQGYRTAYELARDRGVRGGVAVFHGYRICQKWSRKYQEADTNLGEWLWLLNEAPVDWRTATYWSPHWHVVGLAEDFAEDDADGWVVRRIRSLEPCSGPRDRDAHEDVARCVRYLLSHASYEADSSRDCVRWFGQLATTKFSAEDELSDGLLSILERVVDEIVGHCPAEEDDEDDEDDCNNCGASSFSPIWDAGAALMDPGWCNRIGREQQRRLSTAFEWAVGERQPPPGLKRPSTEEEAVEAFAAML